MPKQIFVNLPVCNVAKSTAFYEALGFTLNPAFSNEQASSMVWSDEIYFMLLDKEFYSKFLGDRVVGDAHRSSGAITALTLDTKEAVQQFADAAKLNGGKCIK